VAAAVSQQKTLASTTSYRMKVDGVMSLKKYLDFHALVFMGIAFQF
jgi:hypothetical protein